MFEGFDRQRVEVDGVGINLVHGGAGAAVQSFAAHGVVEGYCGGNIILYIFMYAE